MNVVTLDSMAFDHFEVVDRSSLSEIEGGNFGEGMLGGCYYIWVCWRMC